MTDDLKINRTYKRRIHIIPVSYAENVDEICTPIKNMEADKAYLLYTRNAHYIYPVSKVAANHFAKIVKSRTGAETECRGLNICDNDFYGILGEMRHIIESETGNYIYINVASGLPIHSIAGAVAAMCFQTEDTPIYPYCADDIDVYFPLPDNMRIETPSEELLKVLDICNELNGKNEKISGQTLIHELDANGIYQIADDNSCIAADDSVEAKTAITPREYNQLQRKYIMPLIKWRYLKSSGPTKRKVYTVTDEGKNALIAFWK